VTALQHEALGTIEYDPTDVESEWSADIPWLSATIEVSLTFDGTAMDQPTLDRLAGYVVDLAAFDRDARAAMRAEADHEESTVRHYLEHHRDGSDVSVEAFVGALRLGAVNLYAGTEISEHEAVFDYSIDPDSTQYLLAVGFDADGRVDRIDFES
jgi:hypothetical protein